MGRRWALPTARGAWASSRPEPQQGLRLQLVPWLQPRDSKPRIWQHVGLLTPQPQCFFQPGSEQQLLRTVKKTNTEQFSFGVLWGHLVTPGDNSVCYLGVPLASNGWKPAVLLSITPCQDAAPSKGLPSPKHHCSERRDPRLWCMDMCIAREECGISALFLQLLFEQRLFQNLDFLK